MEYYGFFISYSSSFCPGVAPTDVLSLLFVLNNNKCIVILNAVTLGGGVFLKLRLYLILFWKLLKSFSARGPRGTRVLIGDGGREIGNKNILALFGSKGVSYLLIRYEVTPLSLRANLECRGKPHLFGGATEDQNLMTLSCTFA